MSFDVAKFSQAGLSALAELTTQKTLKIMQIYVDETERYEEDLEENPAWWSAQTASTMTKVGAEIFSMGVTNGQARIVLSLNLRPGQNETVNVKTIVLGACVVTGGVDGPSFTLCGIIDPNGVDVVYNASHVLLTTKVSMYFRFNNASSITVNNAYAPDYALQSDLDRYVSCHVADDLDTGEAQSIKGHKMFNDSTTFGNTGSGKCKMTISHDDQYHWSQISAYTQVGGNDPIDQTLRFYAYEYEGDFYSTISTNVSILPDHDNAQSDINLGTDDARFTEVNCDTLYSSYAYLYEETYIRSGPHNSTVCTLSANDGTASVKMTSESGWSIRLIATDADVSLDGTVVDVRAPQLWTNNILTSGNITASGNIIAHGYLQSDNGLFDLHFANEISQTTCSLVPVKFNMKRGNIFLALLSNNSINPSAAINAGDKIPSTMDVSIAKFEDNTNYNYTVKTPQFSASRQLTNNGNAFRALNDVAALATGHNAMCLLIAINDID